MNNIGEGEGNSGSCGKSMNNVTGYKSLHLENISKT